MAHPHHNLKDPSAIEVESVFEIIDELKAVNKHLENRIVLLESALDALTIKVALAGVELLAKPPVFSATSKEHEKAPQVVLGDALR